MGWNYAPDSNGLYPAVPDPENPDMEEYWLRDNYWIWRATREKSIPKAFAEIVRKHSAGIIQTTRSSDPAEFHHIHPRYDENLEEIDGEWGWLQWDAIGNLLEVLSSATNSEKYGDYSREAGLVANYLDSFDPHTTPDHGMWEDERSINPSSIAAVIGGFKEYGRGFDHPRMEDWCEQMLREMPRKDLATSTCLYLVPEAIPPYMKQKQLKQLRALEGRHGLIRYPGDNWNGIEWREGEEPEWVIGLGFMYLLTGEDKYWQKLEKLKREHGKLPESFIDGEPNTNHPLLWSEAMYELARKKKQQKSGGKIGYRRRKRVEETV